VFQKKRTKFNAPQLYDRESKSRVIFTKMFRNYLPTQKVVKFEQCC